MQIFWKENHNTKQVIPGLNGQQANEEHPLVQVWLTAAPNLRAGFFIEDQQALLQCQSRISLVDHGLQRPAWICTLVHGQGRAGEQPCSVYKKGFSLAWITLSDKGAQGQRQDTSGPSILKFLQDRLDLSYTQGVVLADEPMLLKATLVDLCLTQKFDLVFTTGGTGVGPRDITPQVTASLVDLRLQGFEQAMTLASMAKTPHGMISRAVAGTLGSSIVVNLPGSPKAVQENLEAIFPALEHSVRKLQGDTTDCGRK